MKKRLITLLVVAVLAIASTSMFAACSNEKKVVYGAGFDASSSIDTAIQNGSLMFTMQQNPDVMGREGMITAINLIKDPNYNPAADTDRGDYGKVDVDTGVKIHDKNDFSTRTSNLNNRDDAVGKVRLITMDKLDDHWKRMNVGAKAEADKESGITYDWQGPTDASNPEQQVSLIQSAVTDDVDVVMLAAANPTATQNSVTEAMSKGVKFIYVDSPSNATGYIQKLSTDNEQAGKDAGTELVKRLSEKGITSGKIFMLRPDTSDSVQKRGVGFKSVVEAAGFTVVENNNAGKTPDTTKTAAQQAINDGAVAIFGTNEGTSVGIGSAIAEL